MATNLNPNEYLQEDSKPFCSTESIFNKKNINRIITLFYVRNQILIGLAVNIILLILLILLKQSLITILLVICTTSLSLIIGFTIIDLIIKNNITKEYIDKKIYFYENFIVTFDKENLNNSQNIILYNNISRTFVTKKFIYFKINKTYLVISNEDITFYKPKIISSLINNNKRVTFTHNKKQSLKTSSYKTTKITALVLFIASILSVLIASLIFNIKVENDIYDFAPSVQVRFAWVFFVPILIPIVTLIFGIKYHFRAGTRKDIIVGAIATAILLTCGSMCFIFAQGYDHDASVIRSLTDNQNFSFPDNYLIINEYHKNAQISYIKVTTSKDAVVFERNMKSSSYWDKVEDMPSNLNNIFRGFIGDYDYYSYYQLNNDYSFNHYGYAMALYDKEQNLFQIICIIND
jgi:hypothetical protein